MQLKPEELPKYVDMIKFLQNRCHVLEGLERSKRPTTSNLRQVAHNKTNQTQKSFQGKTNALLTSTKKFQCPMCEKPHFLNQCKEFLALTPRERLTQVRKMNLCCNCFSGRHTTKDCGGTMCRVCNNKQHFTSSRSGYHQQQQQQQKYFAKANTHNHNEQRHQ
jgi:hypothetical protein